MRSASPGTRVRSCVSAADTGDVLTVDRQLHPGPGVVALVHGVVDQAGESAQGGTPPGGAQVGLGGHGVLAVRQLVAEVGHDLDERHAHVGRRALGPTGRREVEAVQHQAAEGRIVLGQVVDGRGVVDLWAGRSRRPRQSKSLGHSTLNEKSTSASSGSNVAGGRLRHRARAPDATCRSRSRPTPRS